MKGATNADAVEVRYPAPAKAQVVRLPLAQLRQTLGMPDFPEDEALRILRALEFDVRVAGGVLEATVPPNRVDIQEGAADLIEEIARIYGYDRLPATLLADRLPRQATNEPLAFEEQLRDLLASAGMQEVVTYSLTAPAREAPLFGERPYVTLKNPISSERTVMRQSVLASVLEVTAANLRNTEDVRLFEVGRIYVPRSDNALPDEPRRLALVMTGKRRSPFWSDSSTGEPAAPALDFFDLKGVIETLAGDLHLSEVHYLPSKSSFLHPGRSATLLAGGKPLGDFGQLHPCSNTTYGLGERTILVGDFDVDALQAARPPRYAFRPVPRFPAALRDIAIVVDTNVPAERVLAEIRGAGGNLLDDAHLFDVYHGTNLPAGKKSLAFALAYLAPDRTLSDKEIDKAHKKIEDRVKHTLGALIRGKDLS